MVASDSVYTGYGVISIVLAGIGNPILLSLLGSRMIINLKEAGESKTKGEITNHWELNPRNTLSEPQFAAPPVLSSGVIFFNNILSSYLLL